MIRPALLLIGALVPGAVLAQVEPIASGIDSRIQILHFVSGQFIRLQVPRHAMLGILFMPGETVRNATLRDTGSYKVIVTGTADALFVEALGAAPSVLSVTTDKRSYDFELNSSSQANIPYLVRFAADMPPPSAPPSPATAQAPGQYKLSGNRELRPSGMRDDGMRTYIQWSAEQAIPAVFAVDGLGREEMVNGYMREGIFTIDRVHADLVFRIDKAMARARRVAAKAGQ